jgi:hypothetical protein
MLDILFPVSEMISSDFKYFFVSASIEKAKGIYKNKAQKAIKNKIKCFELTEPCLQSPMTTWLVSNKKSIDANQSFQPRNQRKKWKLQQHPQKRDQILGIE